MKHHFTGIAFVGLFLLTALPFVSSGLALSAGFAFSFLFGNPFPRQTGQYSKTLLKLSVVGLGFGVNIVSVLEVGRDSLLLTLISLLVTILVGQGLGRWLQVPANTRQLIAFGTAICGGSAIAAMAPVIKAKDEEIAVSLATIFTLNALALLLFPPLGQLFGLSQEQFGLWAALAIHDTSSVVGAAAAFGSVALAVGTTAKLTRALWIAPCALLAGAYYKSAEKTGIPLFILGFIAAAGISSWLSAYAPIWDGIYGIARQALVMTLFLIGSGLTREVLKQVGLRPLLMGLLLWILVSAATLTLICSGVIG
ncbi:YeiH family protein [Malonomonas rubra]|uniref:YeiH family protein n=1 Tax=Malonomonas rubra TaxID=57040 RepID=UPI001FC9E92D|nr:putative sulfate exporter family transporter [Malonomonas rubra]